MALGVISTQNDSKQLVCLQDVTLCGVFTWDEISVYSPICYGEALTGIYVVHLPNLKLDIMNGVY